MELLKYGLLSAAATRTGTSGMTGRGTAAGGVPGARHTALACTGQRRMGGKKLHELFAAAFIALWLIIRAGDENFTQFTAV
jgi:hypothetical protein